MALSWSAGPFHSQCPSPSLIGTEAYSLFGEKMNIHHLRSQRKHCGGVSQSFRVWNPTTWPHVPLLLAPACVALAELLDFFAPLIGIEKQSHKIVCWGGALSELLNETSRTLPITWQWSAVMICRVRDPWHPSFGTSIFPTAPPWAKCHGIPFMGP